MVDKIKKRDGKVVKFDSNKIKNAILSAMNSVDKVDKNKAEKITKQVVEEFKKKTPSVENVQNIVEKKLIENKLSNVAKSYILYRKKRNKVREVKKFLGVKDDLKMGVNQIRVLKKRYLRKDLEGKVKETPEKLFKRVSKAVSKVDEKYDEDSEKSRKIFFEMMKNLEFLPNSPTLMNAGTPLGQLSACFVLPLEDSLESIFETLKQTTIIHHSGGGTGFNFSNIRPRGDIVKSTRGVASGPLSFIRVYNTATDVIKQGGRRRGANMGILEHNHPDIIRFINSKQKGGFTNFNFSVSVTNEFMKKVRKGEDYWLINPRNNEKAEKANAKEVFEQIIHNAWMTGDPGLIFIDEINRKSHYGMIKSTNPCGEQPLLSYESCNLGSINLTKFVKDKEIDWDKLKKTVHSSVHFLDNVINANKYTHKKIKKITLNNRKIGLGVMGWAEMLIKLRIPYNSKKALSLANKLMKFIYENAREKSEELGRKRGDFPNFKKSKLSDKYEHMRNNTVTTIAPTGTISILANCSSGIEPLFAVSFIRNVMEGTKLLEVNEEFEEISLKQGFYSKNLMKKIAESGSVQNIDEVPEKYKKLFITALDISYEWHIKMQAVFQKHVDNAVSKTINFPKNASVEEVRKAYLLAYEKKCKGITIYRYGSKSEQVLYIGPQEKEKKYVSAESEYAGGCPSPVCPH